MPKVYITHEIALDYSRAEDFGELVPVTADDFTNLSNSLHNQRLVGQVKDRLKHFEEEDFLLISGSPYVSLLCAMVIARKQKSIKVLRWSNQDRQYYPLTLAA